MLTPSSSFCFTLQADLAAKYVNIFQNYGLDLEAVQKLYEKHKHAPPVVRNAPPVAGNIMWARQLLRRIEMPMKRSVCVLSSPDPSMLSGRLDGAKNTGYGKMSKPKMCDSAAVPQMLLSV